MQNKSPIPPEYLDLFEKRALAYLGTVMPDGTPHVTPVWIDFDGQHLLVNSAQGRQKDRNMRRDPAVGVTIQDPDDSYRYLAVIGRVVDVTTAGADEHIDKMARKYTEHPQYPWRKAGEVRVIYRIAIEKVLD